MRSPPFMRGPSRSSTALRSAPCQNSSRTKRRAFISSRSSTFLSLLRLASTVTPLIEPHPSTTADPLDIGGTLARQRAQGRAAASKASTRPLVHSLRLMR